LLNFRGDGRQAEVAFRRALDAWPSGGAGHMALIGLGLSRVLLGADARSARTLHRALEQLPSRAGVYRFLTAAAAPAGAQATARGSLLLLQRAVPDLPLERCARAGVLHPSGLARVLDGLARAGLPA
jgi:hypothetical protein